MAERIAVFVDAGYLFAQGSSVIAGSRRARPELLLDPAEVIAAIKSLAADKAPHCRLLRIYWYDGTSGGLRPTADQALLAQQDDVKLRLGLINSHGQQKGVDSLIVTDLIELARLTSICDAVLLSGDEDVRIGVQIAQNYGVRVHLLGISPCRGSQSQQLIHEADTTTEWGADIVSKFLSVRAPPPVITPSTTVPLASYSAPPVAPDAPNPVLEKAIAEFVAELKVTDLLGISAYWEEARGVPSEFDRRLLPCGRLAIGRNLDRAEMTFVRSTFQQLVKDRLREAPTSD